MNKILLLRNRKKDIFYYDNAIIVTYQKKIMEKIKLR